MPVLETLPLRTEEAPCKEEVSCDEDLTYETANEKYPLCKSLFPNIPPTVRFFGASEASYVIPLPQGVRANLRWKWTTITPSLVKDTVKRSGFRMTKHEQAWIGMWGKHLKCAYYCEMNIFQKVNHFPGSFHLGRKDKLHMNLSKLRKNSTHVDLDFVPRTFLLPQEARAFTKSWKKEGTMHRWIAKPPASSRGTGVFIVSRWGQVANKLCEPLVVQKYIHKPFLIKGSKFDLRLYALVTGWDPLRVYVYKKGMLRFATVSYSDSVDSFDNALMHLTNYSLNKHSQDYSHEQKWSLDEMWSYFKQHHPTVNCEDVWNSLVNVIVKTLVSAEGPIGRLSGQYAPSHYSCFELFGFDILLDSDLKPWLLEVNISPSMRASSENDAAIKEPLVKDLLNVAGFRLPKMDNPGNIDPTEYGLDENEVMFMSPRYHRKHLSAAEIQKKQLFSCEQLNLREGAILENLVPCDIVTLVEYEDELNRASESCFTKVVPSATFEHIIPSRYNNKLLNAWENRYGNNREKGCMLLSDLCSKNSHIAPSDSEGKREASLMEKKRTTWRSSVRVGSAKSRLNRAPQRSFNRAFRIKSIMQRFGSVDSLSGSSAV